MMEPAAPLAIFATDLTGSILGVNHQVEQITGQGEAHLVGGPLEALFDSSVPLGVIKLTQTELATGAFTGTYLKFASQTEPNPWYLAVAANTGEARVWVAGQAAPNCPPAQLPSLFNAARTAEQGAIANGVSLESAAGHGARFLANGLGALDSPVYQSLLLTGLNEPPGTEPLPLTEPTDAALASVWSSATGALERIERQQAAHAKLRDIARLLVQAASDLIYQIEPMDEAATQIMEAAQALAGSATPLTAAHRVGAAVEQTGIRLRALQLGVDRSRELIANQCLLLDVANRLCTAVLQTLSASDRLGQRDLGLVVPLAGGLHTLAPPLAMGTARVTANLSRLSREATEAAGQVRMLDTTLTSWELLAGRFDLPAALIPDDLDATGAALKLDGMRDLARGAVQQAGADAGAYSAAAAGVTRALRYAPGFSFALRDPAPSNGATTA
jgi:PAS domain-containing protein